MDDDTRADETRGTATLERVTAAWQQAADALRDSERRYRELVEYSLGLICTHDLTGNILSINPAAANLLGYRPEDGIGRNLRQFLSPDTRHLFDEYLQRIRDQGHDAGLMRVVSRSGAERVWMYRNVLSHGPGGTYVLGHAIDVTERIAVERMLREREQALRSAQSELEARVQERTAALAEANERLRLEIAEREHAERSRQQILIQQRDTLAFLASFSDRLAPLVAFEDLVEVLGHLPVPFLADAAAVHLVDDDGSIRVAAGAHAGLAAAAAAEIARLAQVAATGRLAILESGSVAMLPLAMEGRVKAVLSLVSTSAHRYSSSESLVLEDVARRIGLALDRIQLYREAQEANRLKDEFLGTLSHELRTPLNAIFGWARILRTRSLDARTAHAIEVIERNADAQLRLIEEVLDVSRIIRGKMTLAMESVDMASIVRATIDTVRPALHAKRIRFEERIGETPPVVGDSHRLQQVFWNLLSNALKFTPDEGAIAVTLRHAVGSIEFAIADTGVGIRRDLLPFVFDRFRQADSSTARIHGGLGLGLAIVKHIVELHGGTVRAASAGEGHGATFTIELPIGDRAAAAAHPSGDAASSAALLPPLLDGRTVVVVEDHDDARELIVGVLEAAGARVLSAATTQDAIARAADARPDVLVADLGLPGEDGYVLLARMREMFPHIPAIALTAYARATDRERALAAGFQQHVIKPVDPKLLLQLMTETLRTK